MSATSGCPDRVDPDVDEPRAVALLGPETVATIEGLGFRGFGGLGV